MGEQLKKLLQPKERECTVSFGFREPDMDCPDKGSVKVTITPTNPQLEPVSGHAESLYDALHMARAKR